jgi:DedD protein
VDTALRNRLTGAALLILLAVILLPEMLTGEGGARSVPTETVGGVDQPVQSYDFDLSEQAEVPPPAVEAPAPTPTPASPASIPASTPASSPASTAAPPSPVAAPTTSPATPPPAAPVVAVKPASKPVAAPETGYFVQIGVFSNPASANRLATELRKKKFAVVVTKIDGAKPLHRVRVGPEPDRKAAEALAKRLASAGHKGSVVSAP